LLMKGKHGFLESTRITHYWKRYWRFTGL